ncbi:hypothetical protein BH23CHL1_BH23CHL1_25690 [soil metagenome]|jgi:hypothetical protein
MLADVAEIRHRYVLGSLRNVLTLTFELHTADG